MKEIIFKLFRQTSQPWVVFSANVWTPKILIIFGLGRAWLFSESDLKVQPGLRNTGLDIVLFKANFFFNLFVI